MLLDSPTFWNTSFSFPRFRHGFSMLNFSAWARHEIENDARTRTWAVKTAGQRLKVALSLLFVLLMNYGCYDEYDESDFT